MKETEKLGSAQSQKEKIRERYKGIDTDQLDVIPALPQDSFYEDKREKRVAVYARAQQTIRDKHLHMNFKRIITRT